VGPLLHRLCAGPGRAAGSDLIPGAPIPGSKPHILVTGASGFAGGHLARLLAEKGFAVTAPMRRPADAERLRIPGVTMLPGYPPELPSGIAAVVHAAATSAGPTDRLVADNVDLTARLLDAAATARVRHFIFMSSMSVYGSIAAPEVVETTPSVDPDVYGTTKRLGEALLAERCAHPGPERPMTGVAIRLPAVIGAGAARHWLAVAASRLAAGEEVPVFHPRARFNNAVHVADLAGLIANIVGGATTGFHAINVASDGTITVSEAVEILRHGLKSTSRVREVATTRPSFVISIDRARQVFGFKPMTIAAALQAYARETAAAAGQGRG